MKPIVLDIETSGVDKVRCGIWQIGAYCLDTGEEFLEEARIDDEDIVQERALEVIEKTEEELRDKNKLSQKELLEKFFKWVAERPMKNFLCQNPQFDVAFLEIRAIKYGLKMPFHYRSFDLHNFAQAKYYDLHEEFLIKEDHSDMGLTKILEFCGMEDNRQAHNALEDAKLTAECFLRVLEGKNLFPEYSQYEIPEALKK